MDLGRQRCSMETASHQLTGNWCTAGDDRNSVRLDAGAVLRLHDGSKVLRSLPWDLHGCKAADEIPVRASVELPMLSPRTASGLYWPRLTDLCVLYAPGTRVIMVRVYFDHRLLLFDLFVSS